MGDCHRQWEKIVFITQEMAELAKVREWQALQALAQQQAQQLQLFFNRPNIAQELPDNFEQELSEVQEIINSILDSCQNDDSDKHNALTKRIKVKKN